MPISFRFDESVVTIAISKIMTSVPLSISIVLYTYASFGGFDTRSGTALLL